MKKGIERISEVSARHALQDIGISADYCPSGAGVYNIANLAVAEGMKRKRATRIALGLACDWLDRAFLSSVEYQKQLKDAMSSYRDLLSQKVSLEREVFALKKKLDSIPQVQPQPETPKSAEAAKTTKSYFFLNPGSRRPTVRIGEKPIFCHELKCDPIPFLAIRKGQKTADFRKVDRDFQVGDYIRLMEWRVQEYSGEIAWVEITHITGGCSFGIPEGYVMLSVKLIHPIS